VGAQGSRWPAFAPALPPVVVVPARYWRPRQLRAVVAGRRGRVGSVGRVVSSDPFVVAALLSVPVETTGVLGLFISFTAGADVHRLLRRFVAWLAT